MTTKTRDGRIQILRLVCLLSIILAFALIIVAVLTPYHALPILGAWVLSIVAAACHEVVKKYDGR